MNKNDFKTTFISSIEDQAILICSLKQDTKKLSLIFSLCDFYRKNEMTREQMFNLAFLLK